MDDRIITPNDPGFDGSTDMDEALFLVESKDGRHAMCECHLCDCDEDSPSGYAWDFTTYMWDGDASVWQDYDGGLYWDYARADEFAGDFPFPRYFYISRMTLVDHDLFHELDRGYDEPGRDFTEDEIAAGTPY